MEIIDTVRASLLIKEKSIRRVVAREMPEGYVIVLLGQMSEYVLNSNRENRPKYYKKLDTLTRNLAKINIRNFDVELMNSPRSLNEQRGLF